MKTFRYILFFLLLLSGFSGFAITKTFTTAGNWNTGGNWAPAGVPAAGDDIIINANCTINVNVTCNSLVINATRSLTNSTFTLTVTTTTNNAGTFLDNNNTGNNRFTGLVTNSGTWTSTAVTNAGRMNFRGGIANNGTFNAGEATFNTAAQALSGASAMSFANAVDVAVTVTNNNTNTVTVTGVLDGSGTWTQGANSTLSYANATEPMTSGTFTVNTCTNTVNYNLAGTQGVKGATYCNLTITGNDIKTLQGATTVTGILAITNTLGATAPTLELGSQNFTVSGTTVISGTATATYAPAAYVAGNGALLNDGNMTGTNIFTGLVTVNLNGNWNTNTAGVNVTFGGGISNFGRFFDTNTVTFNASQALIGGSITNFNGNVTINSGVTVTNGSLVPNSGGFIRAFGTIEGANATATWFNIGSLKYDNGAALMSVGTFKATEDYNSVDYICNCAQVVRDIDYYNLLTTNSTKTMSPTTTRNVNGMLTVRSATFTVSTIKLEVKLASIGSNATFNNTSTAVAGTTTNFNQNTAFTGKFNTISASNDQDSYAYSNNGSDVVLQRGVAGGVYAVKRTNFTAAPTQFVAQFEFETKSKSTNTNIATILLGNAFTNDITRNTATARLQFNIDATNNRYSITNPDGTGGTSPLQDSRQTITWVVNNAAGTYNYTDPLGVANTVTTNAVDIWIGTTLFRDNSGIANSGTPVNDIKIIYDTNASETADFVEKSNITISNLRFYLTPPTNISGVINRYTKISNINMAKTQLTVASIEGFVAGNRVMVIQMKNATIDNTDAATYGNITNYNNAGRFEFARIASVTAGLVTLTSPLIANYDAATPDACVQLIFVPEYNNVTVDGLLTAQAWNPATQTGGVLALVATGNITLQADVDVTGLGFKGGIISGNDGSCRIGIYRNALIAYGQKGEGITTDTNNRGRGKLANGGGGGNPHNSGGGGGGNFGKGANGARQWNCTDSGNDANNDCVDPVGLVSPATEQNSGVGGTILDYTTGRIFLGGGGGSGQQNDNFGTSGANGGGIIVMTANAIIGNGFLMSAKGASVLATAENDAGGGGGAGGAIFLDTKIYLTTLRVNVQGGKGGDVNFETCHGNGGGGGGGVLRLDINPTPANITVVKGGGPSSKNADNSNCALTGNPFFCAESTGTGGIIFNNVTILPVTITNFEARKIDNKQALLEWTTTQEVNNKQIEVERSTDGFTFTKIQVMTPKGSKTSLTTYSWIDANPLSGLNYYRIKFVDFDAKFTNSQIKALHFEGNSALLTELYPNPATKNGFFISLRENAAETEKLLVAVYDMLGRKIEIKVEKTEKGLFQITPQQANMPIGMYVVEILGANFKTTKKLMIE